MKLIEDMSAEQNALAGDAYIAVPLEIYQSISGLITLTAYSACRDIVQSYMSACERNPLEKELIAQVSQQIASFMENVGYKYNAESSQTILEYVVPNEWQMPNNVSGNVTMIKTIDEWAQYRNKTNAEPDFLNSDRSIACAVVESGAIISCACINDAFYADGAVEIYVETMPKYQNQGLGAVCVATLISYMFQKKIPIWYKCYENNPASAAIAKKCGLALKGKRLSFVCYADE